MKRVRGVTLVELVLTISITLILSSVAIGGLVGVQSWRAASAVRRIHADLSYARASAMLSTRRTLCAFDLSKHSYELRQEPQPATGTINGKLMRRPLDDQPWRVKLADLGGDVRLVDLPGSKKNAFGFGADGLPVQASGKLLGKDIRIRFTSGAEIVVRTGSGLCELVWP